MAATIKSLAPYALLLACTVIATLPFQEPGFFRGNDLTLEIVRIAEYAYSLQDGQFPVRLGANLEGGYGYPIYNFFPPVFLQLVTIFMLVGGLSIVVSIKLALFLLTLAAGLGMYWFAREHLGREGGLLAAGLYVLAPYHFFDIFSRNAFSEFTALALAPFVFAAMARHLKAPTPATGLALALAAALFVLSHNLSVLMYLPLFAGYAAFWMTVSGPKAVLGRLVWPLLLAFLLSAFYTLPLVFERQYVQLQELTTGKFAAHANLLAFWYFAMLRLGLLHLLFAVLGMYAALGGRGPTMVALRPLAIGAAAFLLLCFYLNSAYSAGLWRDVGWLQWLQFPWRLLSPISFVICFLAGFMMLPLQGATVSVAKYGSLALASLFLILFPMQAMQPDQYITMTHEEVYRQQILTQSLRTTVLSEYLPIWVREQPKRPVTERLTASSPDVVIETLRDSGTHHAFRVTAPREVTMLMHVYYFPGWSLQVNDEPITPAVTRNGLMQFTLPPGSHRVTVRFRDTWVRRVGNGLSLLGAAACLAWPLAAGWRHRSNRGARRGWVA